MDLVILRSTVGLLASLGLLTASSPDRPGTHTTVLPPAWIVTFHRAGPIRFGMSVGDASKALGQPFPDSTVHDTVSECPRLATHPSAPAGLSFMVLYDTIVGVEVKAGSASTVDGFRIGSTERELRRHYGNDLETDTSLGGDELLILSSKDPERGFLIIFDIENGRVASYRAGRRSPVQIQECS